MEVRRPRRGVGRTRRRRLEVWRATISSVGTIQTERVGDVRMAMMLVFEMGFHGIERERKREKGREKCV